MLMDRGGVRGDRCSTGILVNNAHHCLRDATCAVVEWFSSGFIIVHDIRIREVRLAYNGVSVVVQARVGHDGTIPG